MGFGEELKRRREAQRLSQDDLGERAGVSGKYIGEVERNEKEPGLGVVMSLAKGLGIPAGHLFGVEDLPADALDAARAFAKLAPEHKAAVLVLLHALGARGQ